MTRKDEETKEQEALLVLLMLMVFPPKIIIIISTKNRKIARRKVSFCCYLASTFSLFCVCAGATATTAAVAAAISVARYPNNIEHLVLQHNDVLATNIFGKSISRVGFL